MLKLAIVTLIILCGVLIFAALVEYNHALLEKVTRVLNKLNDFCRLVRHWAALNWIFLVLCGIVLLLWGLTFIK